MSLTVLSFGGGQDSTALLYEIAYNPDFRIKYNIDLEEFVVVMAATGNEHDHTNQHVEYITHFCHDHNIKFAYLSFEKGYHPKGWNEGLIAFYERTTTVGSKAFKKTCTDNLKLKPIYRWLNHYVIEEYDLFGDLLDSAGKKTKALIYSHLGDRDNIELCAMLKKDGIKKYAKDHGKINMIIGIAAGEEVRASSNEESKEQWMRQGINKLYPLIDLGWDRQACQDRIAYYKRPVPMPSNCILCPFMSLQELLYLYRFERPWYEHWVVLERKKLERFADRGPDKNLGVWGKKPLPEMLKQAIEKYGHLTNDELKEYKMSHGHCVKSKY